MCVDLKRKFAGLQRDYSPEARPFYCHLTSVTDTKTTFAILESGASSHSPFFQHTTDLTALKCKTWSCAATSRRAASSTERLHCRASSHRPNVPSAGDGPPTRRHAARPRTRPRFRPSTPFPPPSIRHSSQDCHFAILIRSLHLSHSLSATLIDSHRSLPANLLLRPVVASATAASARHRSPPASDPPPAQFRVHFSLSRIPPLRTGPNPPCLPPGPFRCPLIPVFLRTPRCIIPVSRSTQFLCLSLSSYSQPCGPFLDLCFLSFLSFSFLFFLSYRLWWLGLD